MTSNWPTLRISDIGTLFDGPHATPKRTKSGPVFLGISSLVGGRIDLSKSDHLSEESFDRWTRRVTPQTDDVVFSYETRLGEAAIIPAGLRCCLGRRMALLRLDRSKVIPRYFLYYFLSPEFQGVIRQRTVQGSTVPRILLTEFPEFPVKVPPLPVQQNICDVLSAFDSSIEHNKGLASKLEAAARTLFKSWFVDFDPVRAKAAGESVPGLADDIAKLFPDRLVDSEIGEIPEKWCPGSIGDIASNVKVSRKPDSISSNDKYLGLEHFERQSLTLWKSGVGSDVTSNKYEFSASDILFGKLRPYFHKVAVAPFDGVCSTDVLVIRANGAQSQNFVSFMLSDARVIEFVTSASTGTRMPRTNWKTLASYPIAIPDKNVLQAFQEITSPIVERMLIAAKENDRLIELRDLLLPRLISGKLEVADAEEQIEDAIA